MMKLVERTACLRPTIHRSAASCRMMSQACPNGSPLPADGETPVSPAHMQKLLENHWEKFAPRLLGDTLDKNSALYTAACEQFGMPQTDFLWNTQHISHADTVLQQTRSWVENMLAGQGGFGICPFVQDADHAGLPDQLGKISYTVSAAPTLMDAGRDFWQAAKAFREDEGVAAMLVVFPQFSEDFLRFLLWGENMAHLQFSTTEMELKRTLFHPRKVFDTSMLHESKSTRLGCVDRTIFIHRSPYPTLCVQKRRKELEVASKHVKEVNDMQRELVDYKLAQVGKDKLQSMLDAKDWEDMRDMEAEFQVLCPFHAALRSVVREMSSKTARAAERK